jgi:hypothetical protein
MKGTLSSSANFAVPCGMEQIPHIHVPVDLRISITNRQNGQDKRSPRCSQIHQQCREGRKAPGPHPTELEGHRKVLGGDAEAWYVTPLALTFTFSFVREGRKTRLGDVTRRRFQHSHHDLCPLSARYIDLRRSYTFEEMGSFVLT